MLSYNESLKILKETNALLEGHFILSSGLHSSNQYVQCAKLLSYPKKLKLYVLHYVKKLKIILIKLILFYHQRLVELLLVMKWVDNWSLETIFAERARW